MSQAQAIAFTNARLVLADRVEPGALLVRDGVIAGIGTIDLPAGVETVDCGGRVDGGGIVDGGGTVDCGGTDGGSAVPVVGGTYAGSGAGVTSAGGGGRVSMLRWYSSGEV